MTFNEKTFHRIISIELNKEIRRLMIEKHIYTLHHKIKKATHMKDKMFLLSVLNNFKKRYCYTT
jgi:hypothetical protein